MAIIISIRMRSTDADMQARLIQVHQSDPEAKMFVRGDREAVHGNIDSFAGPDSLGGVHKISFEIKSQALGGAGPGATW